MTNLRAIKSTPSAEVEIKDDVGAPTGVFFTMAGPTHAKRKAATFAAARKAQAGFQKTGKFALDDPAEQFAQNIDNLVEFTLGWRVAEGSTWTLDPYSPAAARSLYEDDEMAWLVDQLQISLNEKERFMKRSVPA